MLTLYYVTRNVAHFVNFIFELYNKGYIFFIFKKWHEVNLPHSNTRNKLKIGTKCWQAARHINTDSNIPGDLLIKRYVRECVENNA